MVVVVQHDPWTHRPTPGHEVVGCQHPRPGRDRDGGGVPAGDAVGTPGGAGRHQDVLETELGHVRRAHLALAVDLDIGQRGEGLQPMVDHAAPRGSAGQRRLPRHPPTQVTAGLGQHDVVPADAQRTSCFEPCRPRATTRIRAADPRGLIVSGCQPRRNSSPMLGFCVHRMGDMVRSPDTHMLQPMHSRISSGWPDWILFGRKGSAIDGLAAPIRSNTPDRDLPHHEVRGGEPAHPDRPACWSAALSPADVLLLLALRAEPGGGGVVLPVHP